jgi:hypothetical protein
MTAPIPFSEVARLDSELVRLARGASSERLAVGAMLDTLASSGGHHELGFSSLEAYARERCERTGRWAADTRALACGLRSLPRIRDALRAGEIGWSTAELLARHVTANSEPEWLERARKATVRELRVLLARQSDREAADVDADADAEESEPTHALTVGATREDGWMFEAARKVAEAVAGPTTSDRLLQMLLAEGYSTLLELIPEGVRSELYDIEELEREAAAESEAHAAWCAQRRCWRNEAEELCERHLLEPLESGPCTVGEAASAAAAVSETPEALDRAIRRLCSELSRRDLALGIVAESARKAEVWRRLGFATEAQYARERVGVSLSSLKAKRILAARTGRVPELATALSSGRLGYEAAYLLSRVVTPKTADEWIRRAERRTVKNLREEVDAAELLIRMGLGRDQSPLDDQSLEPLFELERCMASGDLFGRAGDTKAGDCSEREPAEADERAERWHTGQMSGVRRAARLVQRFGRVRLRWVVSEATHRFWRGLERVFIRVNARVCRVPASFLRFLCENFCRIWLPALRRELLTETGEQPEYFRVYRRDVFRCASPVCTRRDVTPHHLEFRSHGGGDEDENVASLCVFCHLRGIHEGRIAADPPASRIRWRIGRTETLRVEGRTRVGSNVAVAPAFAGGARLCS